jgi:hypothetical protein
MVEVSEDGENEVGNLLALCPTCHALHHRGTITRESIYTWKSVLVSLSQAFDIPTLDLLLFLRLPEAGQLRVSGDGVVHFSRLIGAGLATFHMLGSNGLHYVYRIHLTEKGEQLVDAWLRGDRLALERATGGVSGTSDA